MKIRIAVLNYNGKALLEECLPSIIESAKNSRFPCGVTVIDNRSADGSVDFLKEFFPEVDIFIASANKVYSSYNEFFRQSEDDLIAILNSDIKADPGFIDPLVVHFKKPDNIFFVSSRVYFFDKTTYQGDRSKPKIHFGIISSDTRYNGYERLIEQGGLTFSTGNGLFDRKKFLELDGFDDIYLPGRYEDVDFCYRGWKSGYRAVYEPRSILYHKGYGSFGKEYRDNQISGLVFRNSLIFMCKNITSRLMLVKMFLWLIPRLIFYIVTFRFFFIRSFFQFLHKFSDVLKRRRLVKPGFKLNDRQLIEIFKDD